MMNLANYITIMRILLVPIVVWCLLEGYYQLSLVGFIIAGVSDAIDGILARHAGMATKLGAYLDPLADKALLISIYITLALTQYIPIFIVIIIIARDIIILGGVMLATFMGKPLVIKPIMTSKITTFVQIVYACLLLISLALPTLGDYLHQYYAIEIMGLSVIGFTLFSCLLYIKIGLHHLSQIES